MYLEQIYGQFDCFLDPACTFFVYLDSGLYHMSSQPILCFICLLCELYTRITQFKLLVPNPISYRLPRTLYIGGAGMGGQFDPHF